MSKLLATNSLVRDPSQCLCCQASSNISQDNPLLYGQSKSNSKFLLLTELFDLGFLSEEMTQKQHDDLPSTTCFIQGSSDQETSILKMTMEFMAYSRKKPSFARNSNFLPQDQLRNLSNQDSCNIFCCSVADCAMLNLSVLVHKKLLGFNSGFHTL